MIRRSIVAVGLIGALARQACIAVAMAALFLGAGSARAESYAFITKWGTSGSGDGQFTVPEGVAVDASGNVYVSDSNLNRIQKFSPTGTFITKWGTSGSGDGQFNYPYGVAVDASGNVYVAEVNGHRIQKFSSSGTFIAKWGTNGSGDGQFNGPYGVAADASGNVYVTEYTNNRIQKFSSTGTFIAKWGSNGSADGQFANPRGVAVDASGNVYVADTGNHRIQKFSSTGTFITKWGTNGSADGEFVNPFAVAVGASGNVYAADYGNHRIQKFSSTGTFIAKWGTNGAGDGQFAFPEGVAADAAGNAYAADTVNDRIQKFRSDTLVSSLPFTEDFSDTAFRDFTKTTADWNTELGILRLPRAEKIFGGVGAGNVTGANISSDAHFTQDLALGDVDGDGDLDMVAVTVNNGQRNRLYLNNGTSDPWNGVAGVDITTDVRQTMAAALGDVDADGDLDLVIGNTGQPNRLYLNDGAGTPWDTAVGQDIGTATDATRDVELGDVDGDGDLDLVTGTANEGIFLYLNNGTANPWSAASPITLTSNNPHATTVALGDMDGDGDSDLVVGNAGSGSPNSYYANNGTANPWNGVDPIYLGSENHNTNEALLGDVDGDGDLDVITVCGGEQDRFYLNNGTSTPWAGVTASTVSNDNILGTSGALADIDNDGDLDLVVGSYDTAGRVYLNDGTASPFDNGPGVALSADNLATRALTVGDVDSDGDLDVVCGNEGLAPGAINRLYLNSGTRNPWAGVVGANISSDNNNTFSVSLCDVERDGDLDLITSNVNGEAGKLYLNDGVGNPWDTGTPKTLASSMYASVFGDVDFDGDPDMIASFEGGGISLFRNNGTTDPWNGVSGVSIDTPASITFDLLLRDVTGDANPDLIAINYTSANTLHVHNGTSNPWSGVARVNITSDAFAGIDGELGDVDRDGDLDLVVGNWLNQRNRLYLNNGTSTPWNGVTGSDITTDAHRTGSVQLGDLDGDGDLDLAAGNDAASSRWYRNNGTTDPWNGVMGTDIINDVRATYDLVLIDVEGDGDLDVVQGNRDEVSRLIPNNGTINPFVGAVAMNITPAAEATNALAFGDLDSDGDQDLVLGNTITGSGNGIDRVYLNQSGPFRPWNANTPVGSNITSDTFRTFGTALGDIDRDGDLDLVASNMSVGQGTQNRFYLNNGSPDPFSGASGVNFSSDTQNGRAVALGDVDGDGDLDAVVANHGATSKIYLGDGSSTPFGPSNTVTLTTDGLDAKAVALGDIDNDGDLDPVIGTNGPELGNYFLNDGTGLSYTQRDIGGMSGNVHAVALGDLNGDGRLDVVLGRLTNDFVYQLNDASGAPFDSTSPVAVGLPDGKCLGIALGDLDGDGDLDVVLGMGSPANKNYVMLNNGTSTPFNAVSAVALANDYHYTNAVAVVDLDSDGDLDVVAANGATSPGEVNRAYLNNGTGTSWTGFNLTGDQQPSLALAVGDVDGDGRVDVVVGNDEETTSGRPVRGNRLVRGRDLFVTSGDATSIAVSPSEANISTIALSTSATILSQTTVRYWLSNDGGAKWLLAKPGAVTAFTASGYDPRWRAELRSLSPTISPEITSLSLSGSAPVIEPPVPNVTTSQDNDVSYDLTQHETDAEDSGANLNWSIDPDTTALYAAVIDANDLLTITPELGQTGEQVATLTLTDSDGLTDTQDITINIGSSGPTPPTVVLILPEVATETDNLLAIVTGGTVGPGLTRQFEYEWSNGVDAPTIHGPTTSITDLLPASATVAEETWSVRARTYDDTDYSSYSNTLSVGPLVSLGGSVLQLFANPSEITLGQAVYLNGSITPTAAGFPIFFDQTATPPGGTSTTPSTQYTNFAGNVLLPFVPDEAGAWSFVGEWPGTDTILGDAGNAALTVLKAQPTLTMTLSASSAPTNFDELTATVQFAAPIPATLGHLVEDLAIALFMKKPDASSAGPVMATTDANGVAVFPPSAFDLAGIAFDEPGTWQFLAEFATDGNFRNATSLDYDQPSTPRLTIKDGAGYALLVLGKLDNNGEGLAEHGKTLDSVYRSFIERGFAHDDIYYLRAGTPGAGVIVDDATPSKGEVELTIENEILGRMTDSPAPFYLVMIDHGSPEKFFIYSGAFGPARVVTPVELDGYLDTLQTDLAITNPAATDEDIVVVLGACYSGSFIPFVSGPHRTIVTSASANQVSHRGPFDPAALGGLRDGEIFVSQLFRNLAVGGTLKESFEKASSRIVEFTLSRSNPASFLAQRPQEPRLDDNGDGVGNTVGALSFEPGHDGANAFEITLGIGVNSGDSVAWVNARQTVVLGPTDPVGILLARATQQPSLGHTAWIEIKTPAFEGAVPSASGTSDEVNIEELQRELDIANISSDNADPVDGQYEWSALGERPDFEDLFADPGTYQVYYFVKDVTTGETSSHLLTTIFRADPSNTPPPPVDLLFPSDGSIRPLTVFFAWTESVDPNGDGVTYRAELATAPDFSGVLIVKDNITATFAQIGAADGILDGQTYYWRIVAVDEFGAELAANESRSFSVNQNNPDTLGHLTVTVTDSVTDAELAGAALLLKKGSETVTSGITGQQGIEAFEAPRDSGYSVVASLDGYVPRTVTGIEIGNTPGSLVIDIDDESNPFRWGDVNADGVVGMLDAVRIVRWDSLGEPLAHPRWEENGELDGISGINAQDAIEILKKRVRLIPHFVVDTNEPYDFGPEGGKGSGGFVLDDATGSMAHKSALVEAPRTLSLSRAIRGEAGEIVEVPVTIDDATGIEGALIDLRYDGAALELIETIPGSSAGAWELLVVNGTEPGTVLFAGAGTSTPEGRGTLAVFRFRVKAGASGAAVSLGDATELNDGGIEYLVTK